MARSRAYSGAFAFGSMTPAQADERYSIGQDSDNRRSADARYMIGGGFPAVDVAGAYGSPSYNTRFGALALGEVTTGNTNTCLGHSSGALIAGGSGNVSIGFNALASNISGNSNVAIGRYALISATDGYNVSIGYNSGLNVLGGTANTLIGFASGTNLVSGSSNLGIGAGVQFSSDSVSHEFAIGSSSNYVATNGGPSTYYGTKGASLGYIEIVLNGTPVRMEVFARS